MESTVNFGVVIPCHQEARSVSRVIRSVLPYTARVVVVDDGSRDGTGEAARQSGAQVIRHPHNRGKGAALRSGLAALEHLGCEWALLMDGDGQHVATDITQFLDAAATGDADLVIGDRTEGMAAMPWLRRRVNRWMSGQLSAWAGRELPDTQCGFRMVRLAAWRQAPWTADRFEVESDMLIRFLQAGFRVRFVPVQVLYGPEQSKIHPLRDSLRWWRWWRQLRWAAPPARERPGRAGGRNP